MDNIQQEQLLLQMYGEIKEIKALLSGMQDKQQEYEKTLIEFENRIRRLERFMWIAVGAIGVIEPIVIHFLKGVAH